MHRDYCNSSGVFLCNLTLTFMHRYGYKAKGPIYYKYIYIHGGKDCNASGL